MYSTLSCGEAIIVRRLSRNARDSSEKKQSDEPIVRRKNVKGPKSASTPRKKSSGSSANKTQHTDSEKGTDSILKGLKPRNDLIEGIRTRIPADHPQAPENPESGRIKNRVNRSTGRIYSSVKKYRLVLFLFIILLISVYAMTGAQRLLALWSNLLLDRVAHTLRLHRHNPGGGNITLKTMSHLNNGSMGVSTVDGGYALDMRVHPSLDSWTRQEFKDVYKLMTDILSIIEAKPTHIRQYVGISSPNTNIEKRLAYVENRLAGLEVYSTENSEGNVANELVRLEADIANILARISLIEASVGSSTVDSPDPGDVSGELRVAKNILKLVESDFVKEPDYAFYDSGGFIFKDLTSKSFTNYFTHKGNGIVNPEVVIKSGTLPGQCWPMNGSSGVITIGSRTPIILTSFTVDHAIQNVSSESEGFVTAPKRISVWAIYNASLFASLLGEIAGNESYKDFPKASQQLPKILRDGENGALIAIHLANVVFNPSLTNRSTFNIDFNNGVDAELGDTTYHDQKTSLFSFFILDNWGCEQYTCIYRIRLHSNITFRIDS